MEEIGSTGLSESELAAQVESCVYPGAAFRHGDHLRLAWHYLRTLEPGSAQERMRQTIRRYAESLGQSAKYHDTLTIAWMRLVGAAVACTPACESFEEFLSGHPWLLNRDCLFAFYSRERLAGDDARSSWAEPDLRPLPPVTAPKIEA